MMRRLADRRASCRFHRMTNFSIPALTDEQLRELRDDLEKQLARLRRTMDSTGSAAQPVELDQTSVGRLSRMDALANQQMSKALHEREQGLELKLAEALKRLDEGRYGVCVVCGQHIPFGRLLVMAEARTCATCHEG